MDHIFCSVSQKYIKLKQLYILFSLSVNELINLWFRLEKKVKMISYMTKKQQILTYEKLQTAKKNGIIAWKIIQIINQSSYLQITLIS